VSGKSLAIFGLLIFAAVVVLVAVVIPRQQRLANEKLAKMRSEWAQKYYQELKTNGRSYTSIISPEHMVLLANDPECAQRLTYVHFDMTDLKAPDFSLVQKLPNVRTISFYDCDGITTLLGYTANMPSVNVIHFDYMKPYDELLKELASIPNLKRLLFNDADNGELDVFRHALPNVQIDIYDESRDKDPAFKSSSMPRTPKAFNSKAQGRRASGAPWVLGQVNKTNPNGV
jgi:hypothetical protein